MSTAQQSMRAAILALEDAYDRVYRDDSSVLRQHELDCMAVLSEAIERLVYLHTTYK